MEKSQTTDGLHIGFQNNIFLHDHPEIWQFLTIFGSKSLECMKKHKCKVHFRSKFQNYQKLKYLNVMKVWYTFPFSLISTSLLLSGWTTTCTWNQITDKGLSSAN